MSFFRNAFSYFRKESHKIPQIVKDAPDRRIATGVTIGISFFSAYVMYDQYRSGDMDHNHKEEMNSQLEKILDQETQNGRNLSLLLDRLEEMANLNREFLKILDSLKKERFSKIHPYCKRWPNVEALNQEIFRSRLQQMHAYFTTLAKSSKKT